MEKLNFMDSIRKSITLYFQNFGKFFVPFLWPALLGAIGVIIMLIVMAIGVTMKAGNVQLSALPLGIMVAFILLGLVIYILAVVRFIELHAATAIVTKKLLFEGEKPDYNNALLEVKADGGRLAKTFLWYLLFIILTSIVALIIFGILGIMLFPGGIPKIYKNFVQVVVLGTFVSPFFLFLYQVFALKKNICAINCVFESMKISAKHFLPIALVLFAWNMLIFIISSFLPIVNFILLPAILLLRPAFLILVTYWYLRFTEGENT